MHVVPHMGRDTLEAQIHARWEIGPEDYEDAVRDDGDGGGEGLGGEAGAGLREPC